MAAATGCSTGCCRAAYLALSASASSPSTSARSPWAPSSVTLPTAGAGAAARTAAAPAALLRPKKLKFGTREAGLARCRTTTTDSAAAPGAASTGRSGAAPS
ncbi:hypothetical protein [Kitasatospora sp. P5_F3]